MNNKRKKAVKFNVNTDRRDGQNKLLSLLLLVLKCSTVTHAEPQIESSALL